MGIKKATRKKVSQMRTAKRRRRRELAKLPLDTKYKIVSHLQKIVEEIHIIGKSSRKH